MADYYTEISSSEKAPEKKRITAVSATKEVMEKKGAAKKRRATIGYFGDVVFEVSSKKICTFHDMSRTISARYSDHKRYKKKAQREFEGPKNQSASFKMKFVAGHGVRPWKMVRKIERYCEQGKVCRFVIGGHKIGGGRWTIDSIDEDYREVWNRGELISVEVTVKATEYY